MAKVRNTAEPQSVLTGLYYVFFAIVEPLMALNGAYLTWFKTTQFFHDSVPYAQNLQTTVLDPGTKLALWQLGYSWALVAINSALLFHAIPKALPKDLAAQERLMTYVLLGLLVGDIASFVSAVKVLPRDVLFDLSKWSYVVYGNIPCVMASASTRVAFMLGLWRPTSAAQSARKSKAT